MLQPARAWDCSGHLTPSGLPHLSLHPQDQLHCVAHARCRACFQPVRGRDSSSPFMTRGRGGERQLSPLQEGRGEEGEGHHQSPSPPHFTADEWCGQFSHGAGKPAMLSQGQLYCEVQGLAFPSYFTTSSQLSRQPQVANGKEGFLLFLINRCHVVWAGPQSCRAITDNPELLIFLPLSLKCED